MERIGTYSRLVGNVRNISPAGLIFEFFNFI